MRRRISKIEFYTLPCRRNCGKLLTTTVHSIYGLNELKRKYELICNKCLTEEEKKEMLNSMANGILERKKK